MSDDINPTPFPEEPASDLLADVYGAQDAAESAAPTAQQWLEQAAEAVKPAEEPVQEVAAAAEEAVEQAAPTAQQWFEQAMPETAQPVEQVAAVEQAAPTAQQWLDQAMPEVEQPAQEAAAAAEQAAPAFEQPFDQPAEAQPFTAAEPAAEPQATPFAEAEANAATPFGDESAAVARDAASLYQSAQEEAPSPYAYAQQAQEQAQQAEQRAGQNPYAQAQGAQPSYTSQPADSGYSYSPQQPTEQQAYAYSAQPTGQQQQQAYGYPQQPTGGQPGYGAPGGYDPNQPSQQMYGSFNNGPAYSGSKAPFVLAIIALVTGIIGIFPVSIILAIIALVMAHSAKKSGRLSGKEGATKVMSIIGIVVSALWLLFTVVIGGLVFTAVVDEVENGDYDSSSIEELIDGEIGNIDEFGSELDDIDVEGVTPGLTSGMRSFGNSDTGYIQVPEYWISYDEVSDEPFDEENGTIAIADPLTMYDSAHYGEEEVGTMIMMTPIDNDYVTVADGIVDYNENDDEIINQVVTQTTLGGKPCTYITSDLTYDGLTCREWIVQTSYGCTYIYLEALSGDIDEAAGYVEASFSETRVTAA